MRQNKYEYDAFISHAVEDKIPIANELCAKLERAGLKIWYSGKELGVGDSIEKTIERGLNRSRYGIVIFSPTYLAKNWTIREFYTLLAKEIEEQKVILPVLYNITLDELKNKDLVMADRFAVNSDKGIDFVVDRLVREIKKPKVVKKKEAWFSRIWLILVVSLLANVVLLLKGTVFPRAGYSALPSHAEEPADLQSYPIYATLAGGVQEVLRTSSGCDCRHRHQANEPALFQTAVQGQMVPVRSRNAPLHSDAQSPQKSAHAPAGKIRVSVVFEMDAEGQAWTPLQRPAEDVTHTITTDEDAGALMAVRNRNFSPEDDGPVCLHDRYTGN